MTDSEVVGLLKGDSTLNKARQIFSSYYGMIEQGCLQRVSLTPIEVIRMEFEAVEKIRQIFEKE